MEKCNRSVDLLGHRTRRLFCAMIVIATISLIVFFYHCVIRTGLYVILPNAFLKTISSYGDYKSNLSDVNVTNLAKFKLFPATRQVSRPSLAGRGIPRIIHQTWKNQTNIPTIYRKWMRKWPVSLIPDDWEYWFWTHDDMRRFVAEVFPENLKMYDSYPHDIYRADVFRIMVLHKIGGLYTDLDIENLKSINHLVDRDWMDCAIAQEPLEHAHFDYDIPPPLLTVAFMACRPSHPFFSLAIAGLKARLPRCLTGHISAVLDCTGPRMLTETYWKYLSRNRKDRIVILDPDLFQPKFNKRKFLDACKNMNHTTRPILHQTICKRLQTTDHGSVIPPGAYTYHHYTTIYGSGWESILANTFSITDLVRDINTPLNISNFSNY